MELHSPRRSSRLLLALLAIGTVAAGVRPNAVLGQTVTEFPLPTVPSSPFGITSGPLGRLWFTEFSANKVGSITVDGTIDELATVSSGPTNIVEGPDGNLWFTIFNANRIGRLTPAGTLTEFNLPTANSQPYDITVGSDGNLWYTATGASLIGRITPFGVVTEFPIPSALSNPRGITGGPDGNVWYTGYSNNTIGRILVDAPNTITEFPLLPGSKPQDITVGPDGNLWFTEEAGRCVGRIAAPPPHSVAEFPVPGSASLYSIVTGADGNLWFSDFTANQIGRITPSGSVTTFPLTAQSAAPGIASGPDGDIWFTMYFRHRVAKISPVGPARTPTPTVTVTPSQTFTPSRTPTITSTPTRTATATVTPTPTGRGPEILHAGIVTRVDGCVFCCEPECATTPTPTPGFDEFGRRVFDAPTGQFILVVEGKPGISGRSVGTQLNAAGVDGRPDLQMQSNVAMGNGSSLVCDKEAPNAGGIPAVAPPRFDPADTQVTNALLDLACRFEAFTRSAPCTLVGPATFGFIEPAATAQFCNNVAASAAFPPGEALLTVRLRDTGGETGPEQQIVVRVATPIPTPTTTATPTVPPAPPTHAVCCQCGDFACGPLGQGGSCGPCEAVPDASCDVATGRCATFTPSATFTSSATFTVTRTPTKTPTSTLTSTPSATPTNTPTNTVTLTPSVTPTPTSTPPVGPEDCCQCDLPACGAAITGNCGFCEVVRNAECLDTGLCSTRAPTATPSPTPTIACTCPGDANRNYFVNFADYGSVAQNFGSAPDPFTGLGDASCNGFVNFADYGAVAQNFGLPCPTPTPTAPPDTTLEVTLRPPGGTAGNCRGTCSGGPFPGASCGTNANCVGGTCVGPKTCVGGPFNGNSCTTAAQCTECRGNFLGASPAGSCAIIQGNLLKVIVAPSGVCAPRVAPDVPCSSNAECPIGKTCQLPGFEMTISGTADADGVRTVSVDPDTFKLPPAPVPLGGFTACISAAGEGVGFVDCDGGETGVDTSVEQDHNTTPDHAGNSGSAAGLPDDLNCDTPILTPAGSEDWPCLEGSKVCRGGTRDQQRCTTVADCPDGTDCAACAQTDPPLTGHENACNSGVKATVSGTFDPGDMIVVIPLAILQLQNDEWGPDNLPCSADDTPAGAPAAVPVTLSTGTNSVRIYDANSNKTLSVKPGVKCGAADCAAQVNGAPLSCAALDSTGNIAGTAFGGGFPSLDLAVLGDTATTFNFVIGSSERVAD